MRTGLLRHRLQVRKRQLVRLSTGEEDALYVDAGEIWGRVTSQGGNETFASNQMHAEQSGVITVRLPMSVPFIESDRLGWGANEYDVLAIVPDERNREAIVSVRQLRPGDAVAARERSGGGGGEGT